MLPDGTKIVRVGPNTPSLVQCGVSAYSLGGFATAEDDQLVAALLSSVGICEKVPEQYQDMVTGLSGSGPAYVSLLLQINDIMIVCEFLMSTLVPYVINYRYAFCLFWQCFIAIEALADGAVKMGLPRNMALKFAAQTLMVNVLLYSIIHQTTTITACETYS